MNNNDIAMFGKSIDDAIELTIAYYKLQGRTTRRFALRLQDILKKDRIHQSLIDEAKETLTHRNIKVRNEGLEKGEIHIEIDLMSVAFNPKQAQEFNRIADERNKLRQGASNA